MPTWPVEIDVLRHALKNDSLSQIGNLPLQTRFTGTLKIGDLSLMPAADLSVRVLNRPDDKDAVFGDSDAAHIPYALQSAWVRYTATLKAGSRVAFAPASAGATAEVTLGAYRIHASTDSAFDAVREDLGSPRTLLDLDDVRRLRTGEALTMEMAGALTTSVAFSWSDLLATHLPEIAPDFPVAVKLKRGLEATAAVKVTDQFSVVVSRTADGHVRFAVRKAAARDATFGIEASLGMDASAMAGIDDVLDAIFEHAPPQATELRAAVRKKLAAALHWKAAAGFAYEYARIAENTALADFVLLDETQLAHDYELVLRGDLQSLAGLLRQTGSSRRLVRYLNETTITRKATHGFSLGLGKWAVRAQETARFVQTTRTSLDGLKLITCLGARKYEEKNVPQNDFEWTVDLKAQMEEFRADPDSLDFRYGFHLTVMLERAAIGRGDIARMLDFASMWNARTGDAQSFAAAVGHKGTLRVQILLDHDALASVVAQDADLLSWAEPLAMAMPYLSTFPERRSFAARRDTYSAAWRAWLESGAIPVIRTGTGLTVFERQNGPGSFAWTAGEGHSDLRERLQSFLTGVRRLHAVMATPQPPAAIGDAYDALQPFWSQRLSVAALGRWLCDRVPARATLQVEFGDETITV